MTVNATDADDGVNVNNGIINYPILSEEPKSAQRMFTIDPEKGIISVIGTGLDREVGTLAVSQGTVHQLCSGTCRGEPGMLEPQGLGQSGDLPSLGHCPALGCLQPQVHLGSALGTLQGPPAVLSPRGRWTLSRLGGQWGRWQVSVLVMNTTTGEGWKSRQVMSPLEKGDMLDPTPALTMVILTCRPLPTTH